MNRLLQRAAWAPVACLLATAAQAQISEAQAEQLMKLAGGWAQIGSMAPTLRASFKAGLARPDAALEPALRTQLDAAADAGFDAERMRQVARRTLAEGVQAGYVPELLAWYRSEAGRVVSAAEEASSAEDGRSDTAARVRDGAALLQASTPERRALLAQVVEVTRAVPSGAEFMLNLALAMQRTVGRLNPKAPPADEARVRADFDAQRPQLLQGLQVVSITGAALTYRSVPDATLAAYNRFMSGAAGEHITDLSTRSFEVALLDAFDRLGR